MPEMKKVKTPEFNKDIYKKDFQWQEGEYTVTRSVIWSPPGCHNGCGILYYTKDGKIVKVEGDPNFATTNGRLCARCINLLEAFDHPDRVKWPLKRVGERGENKWERISWDEALDIIEEKVRFIQKEYGPESIVGLIGTGRNVCWQVPYMTYAAFGSPNFTLGFLSGDACKLPRNAITATVMGGLPVIDVAQFTPKRYDDPEWKLPEVIVIWGNNPVVSNADGFMGHWIVDCMRRGTKLIVVDPDLTWIASRAEIWLQIRPGTDAALALGMLNVIINEDLYDHDFVENWCYGFEELKERVQEYPVEKVSEITWIPKDLIIEAARYFAKAKPASIQWGLALDQQTNGVHAAHAINSLYCITGNIDVPGGMIMAKKAYKGNASYSLGYYQWIDLEMQKKRLGNETYPILKYGYSASAHSDTVLEAIESGKPYPIKMLWMESTNPVANMGQEAPRVYNALKKVDFNVVADPFMTPTAVACADLVLPVAMSSERNGLRSWWMPLANISKIRSYYEAKSDEEICMLVTKRLHPEAFPWNSDREFLAWMLKTDGGVGFETFEDLEKEVNHWEPNPYKKYEKGLLRPDGEPGFNTVTGKIELFSTLFAAWGLDPLPYFEEPPESPYSTPELYKEYPLILGTGHRSFEFFHSEHRQLKTMRELHPNPLVNMHPETAKKYGINEGDWVWIENQRGKCKQIAKFNPTLDPRYIYAEHGWWFPEKPGAEPSLYGVFDTNSNNLTTQCVNGPTGYGAPVKCLLCKIYKVTPENDQVTPTEIVCSKGGFGYVK